MSSIEQQLAKEHLENTSLNETPDFSTLSEYARLLKKNELNMSKGIIDTTIEDKDDDKEYWSQFRGDYIDLRDFLKAETYEEKKEYLRQLSRQRVVLIREHMLNVWTFNPERREDLELHLEAIQLIIYSDKEELSKMEKVIEDKKIEFKLE